MTECGQSQNSHRLWLVVVAFLFIKVNTHQPELQYTCVYLHYVLGNFVASFLPPQGGK